MKAARLIFGLAALLALETGCGPRKKEITSIQRREAATLVSEAQFAMTVREYVRAEGLLAKAVETCPDVGDYWIFLGKARMYLHQRETAKSAYKSALATYETIAANEPSNASAMLNQITSLALLGRVEDARALLRKAKERFPANREVRIFVDGKQLDQMISDPLFKEVGL